MTDATNPAAEAPDADPRINAFSKRANGNGHAPAIDEVERLLSAGEKLFDQTRRKIVRLVEAHRANRIAIENRYLAAIEDIGFQAQDELRTLDREHCKALAEQRRILAALSAVRDA